MRPIRCAMLAAAFAAVTAPAPAGGYCSDQALAIADRVVFEIGSWRDLDIFFQRYGACSDNTVDAGLADRVADLLANHWDTLDQLQSLVDHSKKLRDFVLFHIDTLMRPDQAHAILDNVHNRCPADAAALCTSIEDRVNAALPHLWGSGG